MKNINKSVVILFAGSALLSLFAADGSDKANKAQQKAALSREQRDLMNVVNRTVASRQELVEKADNYVRQANTAFQQGEFSKARDLYIKAKQEFQKYNSSFFAAKTAFCDRSIARCYNEWALRDMAEAEKAAAINNFDSAIKICKEAIKRCPERADELESRIAFYEKRKTAHSFEESTSIKSLNPQYSNQEYQVELLLEQGRQFVSRGEYKKAIRKFNDVLLIDPYNDDANQNLLACYDRLKKFGIQRTYNTRYRMISEAAWKFSAPILPDTDDSMRRNLLGTAGRKKIADPVSDLETKINTIKIPNLNLDEVTIDDAINTIRQMAKNNDPSKQGVNIVYLKKQLQDGAAAGAKNNEGGAGEGGGGEGGENGNAGQANAAAEEEGISIKLIGRTVKEALAEICKRAKLTMRLEHDIIVVSNEEIPTVGLETKIFRVEIPEYRSSEDLKKKFEEEMHIQFPKGSELYYHQNINTLVVRNTRRNLELIGKAIEKHFAAGESTPMVQIRFKVIEISQNDLNELAFNWFYGVNTLKNDEPLRDRETRIGKNDQLMNFFTGEGDGNPQKFKNLGFTWQNNNTGSFVDVAMYALNQADSADVLYSPQVTTLVGVTAKVAMFTERTFAEDWEIIDYEVGRVENIEINSVTPFPQLDNEQKLGMIFEVTPQLIRSDDGSGDGRPLIRINADFVNNPIRTFDSWYVYDARTVDSEGNIDGEYYKMPVFNDRKFKTLITIRDGETALLSGMTIDKNSIIHDKIPILGDIPFIGRLFQSRYTQASKSNFLVFATCRLLKPDGTPLYPKSTVPHGEFDFGRNY